MIRILFVCMGNICRSPAAAAILRHRVSKAGRAGQIEIDSCGVTDWNTGDPPDEYMVKALRMRGINLQGKAKTFRPHFMDQFTHLLAVDREVYTQLHQYAETPEQRAKIHLLTNYSQVYQGQDVPDPYGGGQQSFELVLDMLEDACEGIVKAFWETT